MDGFVGEIRLFAGNYAPEGWVLCNGQALSISEYQVLFALLGTIYGGDGVNTFNVPDFSGRLPVGAGQGAGLTARVLGQQGGAETVALNNATMMPPHSHALNVSTRAGDTNVPSTTKVIAAAASGSGLYDNIATPSLKIFDPDACSLAGGGQPHANLMPSTCVSFIIATVGIFPSPA
ncbi:MAG: tail fiber protein [Gallionella sp.]